MKRRVGIILLIIAALAAGITIVYKMVRRQMGAASIGIIGGADGPTAIFVAGRTGHLITAAEVLVLLIAVGGIILWIKRK